MIFNYSSTIRRLVLLAIIIVSTPLYAQFFNIPGTPFVKNFTEEAINNDLTVFDISQGKDGVTYYATPAGLLEYDGVRWKNYKYSFESDLRSVLHIDDQHIYTSGHGGFGYWSKNEKGTLEYTSLFFKQPSQEAPLLPVFSSIKEINGNILFQTFQEIVVYNPITNTLDSIPAVKGFNLIFSSKKRAFIQDSGRGLFEIKGTELVLIEGTDKQDFYVLNVFVKNSDALLIVTKNKGVWGWKEKNLTKKDWKINRVLEKYLVSDAQEFQNDKLIIGTIRKGVYILSSEGETLFHKEKSNGLLDNTVRKVYVDSKNNVWLGMENGLSYIQINSNTNYLLDNKGDFGTVYTSYLKDELLYLGTNQGLFVKNISIPNSKAQIINESIGQIWEIEEIDNQVLVGSHQGISILENKKLRSIHKEGGAWIFRKHPKIDDILYVGFYSGIGVYKRINGDWVFQKKWTDYGESSRFMEFDKYGHLWVTHPAKGYYRLSLSDDGMHLKGFEFYGVNIKHVETYAYLCKIDGDLVFYNPNGFFNYDPIDDSFVPQKYTSELFKNIKGINSIVQHENVFWYSTPKYLGYVLRDRNQFNNVRNPFYSVRNKHLNDFNKFEKINDSIFGIGINNGIIFHNINQLDLNSKKKPPSIRSVQLISKTDTIIAPISGNKILKVPHNNSFIKIGVALPKTPLANSYKIQYRLNGLNNEWSSWDYISELNFPGLSAGNYVLELRSGGTNDTISEVIKLEFYIKSPWYATNVAYVFYGLLFLLLNFLYRSYFKIKSEKKIAVLKFEEEEKLRTQEEKFKFDRLEAEQKFLILREENLSLEIKKKNTELASSTLNNIKKNELLTNLIEDIKEIDKDVLNSSLHPPIKKVIKKINSHLVDKDDWLTFELHFRNAHADFFDKLREKHPDLSSIEKKLCAYLKLNLSSKEIASLLTISIKSVEQGRWRLRKKLDLPKDFSLVNYIQSF